MNITPISYSNNSCQNFDGSLIIKGKKGLPERLVQKFEENPIIQSMAQGENDIVIGYTTKTAAFTESMHNAGEPLYKFSFQAIKPLRTLKEKIVDLFHPKKVFLTYHHRSEYTINEALDNKSKITKIKKALEELQGKKSS